MTDEQIKKALECCIKLNAEPRNWKICKKDCPYKFNCCDRKKGTSVEKDILDLINRQQAENNRQKAEIEKLQLSRKQKLKEIERLQVRLKKERHQFEDVAKMYSEIKAEVIKEFAYELKIRIGFWRLVKDEWLFDIIDNLVKEMVGDDK